MWLIILSEHRTYFSNQICYPHRFENVYVANFINDMLLNAETYT